MIKVLIPSSLSSISIIVPLYHNNYKPGLIYNISIPFLQTKTLFYSTIKVFHLYISLILFSFNTFESANMALSTIAKSKTDVINPFKPALRDKWYEDTKALVLSQIWKYFDPDSNATIIVPMKLVILVNELPLDGNKPFQVQNAYITTNKKYKDVYFKWF